MTQCIYKISYGSMEYYGSSVNFENRVSGHVSKLRLGKHENPILQNIVNKHGITALQFSIVEIVDDKTKLLEIEQKYLDFAFEHLSTNERLNLSREAKSVMSGRSPSLETRKKISDSNKGKSKNVGIVRSEETRRKISEAHKGKKKKPRTDEQKQKMSERMKGRKGTPHTEESRQKLSLANKGKIRENLRKPRAKRGSMPEELKLKISQSLKGNPKAGRPKKTAQS
jgi:group I intron endonuclease